MLNFLSYQAGRRVNALLDRKSTTNSRLTRPPTATMGCSQSAPKMTLKDPTPQVLFTLPFHDYPQTDDFSYRVIVPPHLRKSLTGEQSLRPYLSEQFPNINKLKVHFFLTNNICSQNTSTDLHRALKVFMPVIDLYTFVVTTEYEGMSRAPPEVDEQLGKEAKTEVLTRLRNIAVERGKELRLADF